MTRLTLEPAPLPKFYQHLLQQVDAPSLSSRTRFRRDKSIASQVNPIVVAFYDAVLVYALALNRTLTEGKDPRNGTQLLHDFIWDQTFYDSN